MSEVQEKYRLIELMQDPDAGGKLSLGRTPFLIWVIFLIVAYAAIGFFILWTNLHASPACQVATNVQQFTELDCNSIIRWQQFSGWFDAGVTTLLILAGAFLGAKGVGKFKMKMKASS